MRAEGIVRIGGWAWPICLAAVLLGMSVGAAAAEPEAYLQANEAAQAHAAAPTGWVVENLKTVTASFSSLGGPFVTRGVERDRDAAEIGTRALFSFEDGLRMSAHYALTISPNSSVHSVRLGLEWIF